MPPISTPSEITALFGMVADDSRPALERLLIGASLRDGLDHHLTELAQSAREEEGHSWAQVGKALDISRQAAQQRFGKVDAIHVDLDGTITTTEVREEHVEAMREAVLRAQAGQESSAADDVTFEPVPVEVEVEVEVKQRRR